MFRQSVQYMVDASESAVKIVPGVQLAARITDHYRVATKRRTANVKKTLGAKFKSCSQHIHDLVRGVQAKSYASMMRVKCGSGHRQMAQLASKKDTENMSVHKKWLYCGLCNPIQDEATGIFLAEDQSRQAQYTGTINILEEVAHEVISKQRAMKTSIVVASARLRAVHLRPSSKVVWIPYH